VVDDGSEQQEPGFSLQIGHVGPVDMPESVAPSPWSSTWAQARAEAQQSREAEERFSWMRDADLQMLSMGLEPYPWDHFADVINQTCEYQFQAIEQRTCSEEVLQTVNTSFRYGWNASEATARMLCRMAGALPEGAQLDLIVSTDAVLAALGACADILTKVGIWICIVRFASGRN
jgi:hypothetical protein